MRRSGPELLDEISESALFRLGRGISGCLAILQDALQAGVDAGTFRVDDPTLLANTLYASGLGALQLARVGILVTETSPGRSDRRRDLARPGPRVPRRLRARPRHPLTSAIRPGRSRRSGRCRTARDGDPESLGEGLLGVRVRQRDDELPVGDPAPRRTRTAAVRRSTPRARSRSSPSIGQVVRGRRGPPRRRRHRRPGPRRTPPRRRGPPPSSVGGPGWRTRW